MTHAVGWRRFDILFEGVCMCLDNFQTLFSKYMSLNYSTFFLNVHKELYFIFVIRSKSTVSP
jgi:hypothetical protein